MLEFLSHDNEDAVSLLKSDHQNVKELFDKFEKADSLKEKRKIAAEAIIELKIHASIEEEIFYRAVRKPIGKKVMNEADEEHHVAKILIAELETMNGKESHYDAKFKVLSENVRHHIKEEESDMLPKARSLPIDMNALGKKMLVRKLYLKKAGVATFAEERVVALSKGKGDSPAKAAQKKPPKPSPKKAKSTSSAKRRSGARK